MVVYVKFESLGRIGTKTPANICKWKRRKGKYRHGEMVLYHVCHHLSRLQLDVIGRKESDFPSGDSFPPAGVDLFDFRDDFSRVKSQLVVVVCLVVVEGNRG